MAKRNYNNKKDTPKRSGARYSKISKGNFKGLTIVNAWNFNKSRGMLTAKVAPYGKSKSYASKTAEYQTMMAEVFYTRTGQKLLMPCSMNVNTQVIVLEDLGMCISPNGQGHTSSGKKVTGYFGKFTR